MIKFNIKERFEKHFPWHYNPLQKNHSDFEDLGLLHFDYSSLVDFVLKESVKQNRTKNNKGWSSYYSQDGFFNYGILKDKSDSAKELVATWLDCGWTLDNSCYYEFHDQELDDFYKPLLNAYFNKWGELKDAQLRVFVKPPMTALGLHADTYSSYIKKFNTSIDNVFRIHTFIEDWDWGHYTLIGNHVCHQYTAGQSQQIKPNVFHCSGNIGFNPLITMNITGINN